MKKKLFEIPITDILEVRLGGTILQGSPVPGQAGETNSYNAYDEDF